MPLWLTTLREDAVTGGYVSAEEFDRLMNPDRMLGPDVTSNSSNWFITRLRFRNRQKNVQSKACYYLEQHRIRGVLLWNVWERLEVARALIAEPGLFTKANLKGKLHA